MGKILHDSIRKNLVPFEADEEKQILNGTMAPMLNMWRMPDHLIGEVRAFVMVRQKMVTLAVPLRTRKYFLIVFDDDTGLQSVQEALRQAI